MFKTYCVPLAVAGAIVVFGSLLSAFALLLDPQTAVALFSETGFFEQASPLIWCVAGFYLLWQWRGSTARYLILALTFFIFAGREYDIHKAFTSDSILKINFYKDAFGLEQIFGGMAALCIVGLFIATFIIIVQDIVQRRGYKTPQGQLIIAGFLLLTAAKVMDRAPSLLRKHYDIILDFELDIILEAMEEGFEFFGPLLILIAFIMQFRKASQKPKAVS